MIHNSKGSYRGAFSPSPRGELQISRIGADTFDPQSSITQAICRNYRDLVVAHVDGLLETAIQRPLEDDDMLAPGVDQR